MQVWLRLVVVWFIALALPVQGMVGVTMAHCGPGHERMEANDEASQHRHGAHDAGAAHHHGEPMAGAVEPADHATKPPGAEPDRFADLAKTKCSSCASCCAGSALPSVMPQIPKPASAPAVFAEQMVTVDAFASDGPDRPPRT